MKKLGAINSIIASILMTFSCYSQSVEFTEPKNSFRHEEGSPISVNSGAGLVNNARFFTEMDAFTDSAKELGLVTKNNEAQSEWTRLPNFKLKDVSGHTVERSSVEGNVVVINFWHVGSGSGIQEMPELNRIVDKYRGEPVLFLAPTRDDKETVTALLNTNIFKYKILVDANPLIEKLGLTTFPFHMVVGKDGLVKDIVGGTPKNIFEILNNSIQQNLNF